MHRLSAPICPLRGFDTRQASTEARLAKIAGFEQVKASIRYPFDLARVLNSGKVDPAPYDFVDALARGEESMGGGGTWTLGSKHAEIWAGLAPIASGGATTILIPLENLQRHHVPVYVVHGDAERSAPVEGSRAMVAELKKLGVEHEYHKIPGGTHGDVVDPAIPKIVDFFSQQARSRP